MYASTRKDSIDAILPKSENTGGREQTIQSMIAARSEQKSVISMGPGTNSSVKLLEDTTTTNDEELGEGSRNSRNRE